PRRGPGELCPRDRDPARSRGGGGRPRHGAQGSAPHRGGSRMFRSRDRAQSQPRLAWTIALASRRVAQSAGPFPGGARRRATLPRGGARRRSGAVRNLADRAAPWPLVAGLAEIRAAHRARSRRPAGLFVPALAALTRRKPATRVARAARRAGPRRSVAVLPFRR